MKIYVNINKSKEVIDMCKQILITDEEMDLLGKQIDQQTYEYDGKIYKLNRSNDDKSCYYTEIKKEK